MVEAQEVATVATVAAAATVVRRVVAELAGCSDQRALFFTVVCGTMQHAYASQHTSAKSPLCEPFSAYICAYCAVTLQGLTVWVAMT
jgi:hypothetical protein